MLSVSMTNKQISTLFKKNQNLCEISTEYPSLKQSLIPRHLCTCTKSIKIPEYINTHKLSYIITTEHDDQNEKDSKKQLKNEKEETELIELFQYKQEDEINNKLYKKHRYQWTILNDNLSDDNNEEKRDNTN